MEIRFCEHRQKSREDQSNISKLFWFKRSLAIVPFIFIHQYSFPFKLTPFFTTGKQMFFTFQKKRIHQSTGCWFVCRWWIATLWKLIFGFHSKREMRQAWQHFEMFKQFWIEKTLRLHANEILDKNCERFWFILSIHIQFSWRWKVQK